MYLSAFCASLLSDVLRCAVCATNMFVLVRGITTVNCMIYTAQTCSLWSLVNWSIRCFRGNSRTFRRSAASGPRTDDKCGAMCVMIGPWYHDP